VETQRLTNLSEREAEDYQEVDEFKFRKFDYTAYDALNSKIESGEQPVNHHAVGIMFGVFLKISESLLADITILSQKFDESAMRSFMISTGRLEMAEHIFYSAVVSD